MVLNRKPYLFFIFIFGLISSCDSKGKPKNGFDFLIFRDTPVEELAVAVKNEDTQEIVKLVKSGAPINYQDSKYSQTVLALAAVNYKNNSVKSLLELGADPDIRTGNASALEQISGKYVCNPIAAKLMVAYGAELNIEVYNGNVKELSPLECACIGDCKELFYYYVEKGATIDTTANSRLVWLASANFDDLELLHFLILKKKCRTPYPTESKVIAGKTISFSEELMNLDLEQGSKNWQYREEILNYMKEKGWE